MNEYTILFQIFNKKMKVVIIAETEQEAKEKILNDLKKRVNFEKIEVKNDETVDYLKNIFGFS